MYKEKRSMGRLDEKIAIVTGGGSGLGKADSLHMAREGAFVYVTDVDEAAAQAVVDEIAGNGGAAQPMHLDVASADSWKSNYAAIEDARGRLDILVNNAGIVIVATPEETTEEQFERAMSVMSTGVFLGCKYGLPLLAKSRSASIINMSSTASHIGYPVFFAYSAAKGAVRAMTKSIAVHCQEKGYPVRCNSLHPAAIETPMIQNAEGRPGEEREIADGVLPYGSAGAPKDVASLVVYLASDEARFITGSEFLIDNGLMVHP